MRVVKAALRKASASDSHGTSRRRLPVAVQLRKSNHPFSKCKVLWESRVQAGHSMLGHTLPLEVFECVRVCFVCTYICAYTDADDSINLCFDDY